MGKLARFTNALARLWLKVDPTFRFKFTNTIGRPVFPSINYKTLAEEGYKINDVGFSSIDKFAKNFSQIEFKLFETAGNTQREIVEHPLLTLLARPNAKQGKEEFMESLAAYRLISGNPYIHAVTDSLNLEDFSVEPKELHLFRPDRVRIVPGEVGIISYEYTLGQQKLEFPADPVTGESNILHWPTFHPLNDLYGYPPLMAAARSLDIHNEAMQWNMAFFQNGTRPSGALVYNPKEGSNILPQDAFDRLQTQMTDIYSGSSNNGKTFLLDGGMSFLQMSMNPKDIDFIEGLNFQARNISRVLGVPPLLLNIPGDNTYKNNESAKLGLWEESIIPWGESLVTQYNYWLVPRYGDNLRLVMDLSRVTALEPRRKEQWERAQKANFITVNEKRKMVDMEPVDGGDIVYIQSSQIPITFDLTVESGTKALQYSLTTKATQAELRREQIIQDRLMGSFERGFTVRMFNQLERTSKEAEQQFIKSAGIMDVDFFLKDAFAPMETLLAAHYSSVYESFGRRILNGLKKMHGGIEAKDQDGLFEAGKTQFVNNSTVDRVEDILDTTRSQIVKAIEAGKEAGDSLGEIASAIRDKTGGKIARKRAITIARTETHTASQSGSHGGALATGLELKRIWSAADDDRVRKSHTDAEKDSIINPKDMNERFNVGGEQLLFPGDPTGSAGNIINCRCVIVYEPVGEA